MNEKRCRALQDIVAAGKARLIMHPISDDIVLAGQPQPEHWPELADNFDLVINMRTDPELAEEQAENAAEAGLPTIHLPLPTYELEKEHIEAFHHLLESYAGQRLFIHCRTASRVGLLWMLDRIIHQGWSWEAAQREMEEAGYDADSLDVFNFCAEDYFERADPVAV